MEENFPKEKERNEMIFLFVEVDKNAFDLTRIVNDRINKQKMKIKTTTIIKIIIIMINE